MHWLVSENGYVHVCGHRGHSIAAPENTLAGLRANKAAGGTTAEIDTVLTADGQILVIHDLTVDRTTNGSGVVGDMTLAQLQALDAGVRFAPAFAGERLPTLHQAIALAHELDLGLEVEVKEKRDLPRYAQALAEVLADPADRARVMMISFDHVVLRDLKALIPGLKTGGICHERLGDPVAVARSANLDQLCIDLWPFHPDDARALHAAGIAIRCHAYRPSVIEQAGVEGLGWRAELERWLAEGLIDTLSGDDVTWCADIVARAQAVAGAR